MMSSHDKILRQVLPSGSEHVGLRLRCLRTRIPSIHPLSRWRPPKGAPNVLIVLIDDVGFGARALRRSCQHAVAETLAKNGLKYNPFHTCALCSPTRQAS